MHVAGGKLAVVTGAARGQGWAIGLACNPAKADQIASAVEQTHAGLGKIAILVSNAALSPFMKFEGITEAIWDDLMAINLKGPFLCCRAIIPDMVEAGWGRVINISSSSAQGGSSFHAHYAASKGGVIGLTKGLAMEYASRGITVNNVPPGFVNTEGLRESPIGKRSIAWRRSRRWAIPAVPKTSSLSLATDDADYITGHTLSVNGDRYLN